jgi:carboxypeptidase family protein
MQLSPRSLGLFLLILLISPSLLGQDTASLTGTVTDTTNATITDAQITIGNVGKGIHRTTSTNAAGEYLVSGLPPAHYDIAISAPGFATYNAKSVVLGVAQKARLDAKLPVGTASLQITVAGEDVSTVETQSSELAGTVTGREITQLQLNGRDFTQLITLVPGVNNENLEDHAIGSLALSVNGGRLEYNNWELDGGDMLDNGSNTNLNVTPSIDSISEVRILTSNYGAQYGRNGSGTIEVETKSGASAFHGDVFEFVRNDMFNARNYLDPPGAPLAYKKNNFGYTFGGPIFVPGLYNTKRDKSFFFWSQEWRKESVPNSFPFNTQVPSPAERAGDFSDLCPNQVTGSDADCPLEDPATGARFPYNQVPVAPNATFLVNLIPLPNSGQPGAETYTATPSVRTNRREDSLRVDQNLNSKLRAMFRFTRDSSDQVLPHPLSYASFPTVQSKINVPGVNLVARLTANISKTTLNEFVFSYTTDHFYLTNLGSWQRPAGMTIGALFQNGFGGKPPGFILGGSSAYNGGFALDLGFAPWANSNPTYTYRDNLSKIVSRHNIQLGVYFVAAQKNEPNFAQLQGLLTFDASSTKSTHNPFADLLTGRISSFSQTSSQVKYYNRYKIIEPYFQDDWRATGRLTLNLGLRVSLFGTYRERYQRAYNFDPNAYDRSAAPTIDPDTGALVFPPGRDISNMTGMVQCGVGGIPAGCMKDHLFNFAPRIGFAYDLTGTGKMAVRGGYGIFFEHSNGNEVTTESLEGSPPLVFSASQSNIPGYESIGNTNNPEGDPLFFPLSVKSIPTRAVWPYVQQWHMDVQREFGKAVLTIAYVGSQGTHLTLQRDLNQIPALPLSLNPYKPGEPIGGVDHQHHDCRTMTTPSRVAVTGAAAINLAVACHFDPSPFRPFVGFGAINRLEQAASSTYHALQVSLRRRVGALQFSAAYTYSHAIDNSSARFDYNIVDAYNPSASRASGDFDRRHVLNLGYIYDLPFYKKPGGASDLLGGWQFSGITTFETGNPFSVANFFSDNAGVANGFGGGNYADLIGDPEAKPPTKFVQGVAGPLLFNPTAFAAPRGLTFGNSGRNLLRIPRRTNFDMALFKTVAISDVKSFEFRAEAFNVFNHTQWAGIDSGMTCYGGPLNSAADPACLASSTFLHPNSAHRARILQFGLKFIF